jgi:nicotinamidase-related amidase
MGAEGTALLAIDLQNGIFARPQSLVHDADGVLSRVDALLRAAAERGLPVLFVQDDAGPGIWQPGTEEWQIHPALTRPPQATYLRKTYGDAFRATGLDGRLGELDVAELLVMGAMTDFSIRSTLQRALLRGYSVTLVSDAHSTLDALDGTAEEHIATLNAEAVAAGRRGLPVRALPAAEAVSALVS